MRYLQIESWAVHSVFHVTLQRPHDWIYPWSAESVPYSWNCLFAINFRVGIIFRLRLNLPRVSCPLGFPTYILLIYHIYPMISTLTFLILAGWIVWDIIWSSVQIVKLFIMSFSQSSFSCFPLDCNISCRTLSTDTRNLYWMCSYWSFMSILCSSLT